MNWVYLIMVGAMVGLATGSYLISGPFCLVICSLAALVWMAPYVVIEQLHSALDLHAAQVTMIMDRLERKADGQPSTKYRSAWDFAEAEIIPEGGSQTVPPQGNDH